MSFMIRSLGVVSAFALGLSAVYAQSTGPATGRSDGTAGTGRFDLPATISPVAAEQLAERYKIFAARPVPVEPKSIAEWDKQYQAAEGPALERSAAFAKDQGVTAVPDTIGGVPVVRLRGPAYRPSARAILYLHGGSYVLYSARSSLIVPALLALASGDEVISIDYTVAPRGNWRSATDEVVRVWKALVARRPAKGIALSGDSAGGALAAGSVLKMRDQGLPLPAALYLLSPWSDITATGDTYTTLADADPSLNARRLGWSAAAYATPADQANPYVSPVHGDFARAFPPTIIQVGTREIFLSNSVRLYQAMRSGGKDAVLDVFEGMPHVFPALAPTAPETRCAIERGMSFVHRFTMAGAAARKDAACRPGG